MPDPLSYAQAYSPHPQGLINQTARSKRQEIIDRMSFAPLPQVASEEPPQVPSRRNNINIDAAAKYLSYLPMDGGAKSRQLYKEKQDFLRNNHIIATNNKNNPRNPLPLPVVIQAAKDAQDQIQKDAAASAAAVAVAM